MMRRAPVACALILVLAAPLAAPAQQRGNGGRSGAPPPVHAAPAAPARTFTAPVSQPRVATPSSGGFNFNRDITTRPVPVERRAVQPPVTSPYVPPRTPVTPQGPGVRTAPGGGANYRRAPSTPNTSGGPYQGRFHGPVVRNAHAPSSAWGWNHGVAWRSAPAYWGGGFWGPFALAALTGALLFGSIADDQNQIVYSSYQVEPDSPGAQLLQDYGLQQTDCGPDNLVVI